MAFIQKIIYLKQRKENTINLDEYESIGTPWIVCNSNTKNVTYFDSFEVEGILIEIRKFVGNEDTIRYIYRVKPSDSIMCGYFCIGCIDIMLKGKSLLQYKNLFSPNEN